ncbi:MAG: prohead protease/major capsid protein fusion protein [Parvularculaceae bacterium]
MMPAPVELHIRRAVATLAPASLDMERRTVDAIVATENIVPRFDGGEQLKMSGADLARFIRGPVLDGHRQASHRDQLGVIEEARVEGKQLRARLRFFKGPAGDEILGKIQDGFRGVSVGFSVEEWRDATDEKGRRVRVATRWTPVEISLVAIPADPAAQIRSDTMPPDDANLNPTPAATPAPAATPQPGPQIQTRAAVNQEIRSLARLSGLDTAFADGLIDRQASADDARAAAFAELQRRNDAAGPIRTVTMPNAATYDNPEFRARAIGEALFTRTNPSHKPAEEARPFIGLTLPELAKDICVRAGVPITGLSHQSIITRALQTTSDFALILGDTVGRSMRQAYEVPSSGVRLLAKQTTARDYKQKRRLQLSDMPPLEAVGEGGEYKFVGMTEAGETYAVAKYGNITAISDEILINDDVGAFADIGARWARTARAFENKTLVELLESNPEMSDTEDLFSIAHKNLGSSGGAPDETRLSAARLAMRTQTGLSNDLIAVTPKFVLVPPALETPTEKLLTAIQAATTDDANPFSKLSLLVEPRFQSAVAWFVVADPTEVDGLEYAYLEGAPGPQIESRQGFEVDGVQIKVKLVFGAGFIDWRGWFRNPGA